MARINTETFIGLRSKDVAEQLQAQGMNIVDSTPDELDINVRREIARWGKVVREANIKIH